MSDLDKAIEEARRYPITEDEALEKIRAIRERAAQLLSRQVEIGVTRAESEREEREANREWLKAHSHEYRGQWVAVRGGVLLGASDSLDALAKRVGDTKGVLLTRAL